MKIISSMCFGKERPDDVSLGQFTSAKFLPNPVPTGDHEKLILWIELFIKRGPIALSGFTQHRRDFIKSATKLLQEGKGFYVELVSQAARKYRDDNNLRMQRGKVFLLVIPAQDELNTSVEENA